MGCTDTREIVEARIHHLNNLYDRLGEEIAIEKRKLEEKGFVPRIPPLANREYKNKPRSMSEIKGKSKKKRYKDDYFTELYFYNEVQNRKRNMCYSNSHTYGYDFDDLGNPIGYNSQ